MKSEPLGRQEYNTSEENDIAGIVFLAVRHLTLDHAGALLEKYADSSGEGQGQCEHRSKSRLYHSTADTQELHAAIGGTDVIPIADRDRRTRLASQLEKVRH